MCCMFNTTSGHQPAMSTFSFSVKGGLMQTSSLSIPVGTLLCKRARCSHLPQKRKSSLGRWDTIPFLAVEFCSLSWLQNTPLTSFMLWKILGVGEVGPSSGMDPEKPDRETQTQRQEPLPSANLSQNSAARPRPSCACVSHLRTRMVSDAFKYDELFL